MVLEVGIGVLGGSASAYPGSARTTTEARHEPVRPDLRIYLAYCLKRQPDDRYSVLNRDYKPLGFITRDVVQGVDYPVLAKLRGLTRRKAASLSHDGSDDLESIYLYDDGCVPTDSDAKMRSYQTKLALLAKLKISPTPV